MTDRGFSIQDLCAIKGVSLNRPKQKDSDSGKFQQGEIHRNFDVSSTRIHVERFIGRVRNWTILNNVWPLNRIDFLTSTWQMLCHTVNIAFPPIGPNEKGTKQLVICDILLKQYLLFAVIYCGILISKFFLSTPCFHFSETHPQDIVSVKNVYDFQIITIMNLHN